VLAWAGISCLLEVFNELEASSGIMGTDHPDSS
jgi:hypothetical protein